MTRLDVDQHPYGATSHIREVINDPVAPINAHRPATTTVAIAHDYLTQRGGAERVVLDIAAAFPDAPIYTSLFNSAGTFPEFELLRPQTSALNRLLPLRRNHRLALPLLAPAVSRMSIDANVTLASSSGWAHGIRTSGKKIVYCHAPARWLYQTETYLGGEKSMTVSSRARRAAAAIALEALASPLRKWDRKAALTADLYLANSTITRQAISDAYGIDAEVVPPPPALRPVGDEEAFDGAEPGFFLCVARLLPYKNVDAVIAAVHRIPGARLIVVGAGPDRNRLARIIDDLGGNSPSAGRIQLVGRATDPQLRWLYRNCTALIAASIEDYGLTPLEAAGFGKPTVALAAGGYLDTIIDGRTGIMFASLDLKEMVGALKDCETTDWDRQALLDHAEVFGPKRFRSRLQAIVADVLLA